MLVLSMLDDRATVLTAIEAGAAGYVTKASALVDIVREIHAVHAGQLVLGDEVGKHIVAATRGQEDARFTVRERQLLPLLADAAPTARMAVRI
ncbi:hypothetical protein QT381_09610 [Galbitalea sp. SE-J8]|uniref:hypothetical protein n=1 Tax=Galbitalea sp. SE-J8 TaxID=3054952 RepID=UPI00259CCF10|nr:hypothetical protein [Galbitalea sp. SE-J8]MDM4763262.1 hypothetical protein [Galbitalea sp. SE-J8]